MIDAVTAIFVLSFCGAVFALLVAVAKWQQEKDRRWDEISRAADLEKQLDCAANAYEHLTGMYRTMSAYSDIVKQERDALKDRLSTILCPSNNHVWRDGVCTKCGRAQNE